MPVHLHVWRQRPALFLPPELPCPVAAHRRIGAPHDCASQRPTRALGPVALLLPWCSPIWSLPAIGLEAQTPCRTRNDRRQQPDEPLALVSFSRNPFPDVRRAILELDAVGLTAHKKTDRALVH